MFLDMEIYSTAKELWWGSSILAGVLICKIVYNLTSTISTGFVKRYRKLSTKQRIEWNNRGFSTFHSIVVAAGCLYLLASGLFNGSQDEPAVFKTSILSETIFGFSIGYFISDLAMILYCYPALGGSEYLIHHGLSLFSITQALVLHQAHIYTLMVLFTEATTPFVNLRWYLDVAGLKSSKIYIWNGVALFLGWLAARIILFFYLLWHIYTNFDQVKQVSPVCFYTLMCVPPVIATMNIFWFSKIAKGMVKTLVRARHSQ